MKVCICPHPGQYQEDGRGSGGIWRVINAQARHLPSCGVELVDTPEEADVVDCHAAVLVDTDKPMVASNHGLYWTGDFPWANLYWGFNATVIEVLRRASEITVPADWVAQPIRRDMRKSPVVIPNGVDFEDFEIQTEHGDYVLWAKPRVDVVSDPAPMNELARRATDVQFVSTFGRPAKNVIITGPKPFDEFQKTLGYAMLWLATTRETGDIASKEAMAQGIPVLGWDWGATADCVRHRVTGYLAETGNYDDLLEGLRYCLEHRAQLGAAAREDMRQRFQWKDLIPRYAETFERAYRGKFYTHQITVVVPAYNYAHFLDECLESVKAQTLNPASNAIETIVVDDCSTDNTPEVLARWKDKLPGLRVIRHEQNGGLCAALNAGHSAAQGKYIINLDADNLLMPSGLELLYGALEADPSLDVASGNLARYNPNGEHQPAHDWPFGRIDIHGQLSHYNQLISSSMMRAGPFKRLGGYRIRQRKNEDGEFWCRAMSAGLKFEQVTTQPVMVYRWHGQNKSATEGGEDDPHGPLSWNFHYPWKDNTAIIPFAATGNPPNQSWAVRSYEQPHIAVVIACGPGHDKYLVDALDSVAGQTFLNTECIVANDTGEPLDVATMGHPWVRVVNTSGKRGPAIARNTAIAAAKAPLIVPLDADDIMYPDALRTYYQAWQQHPDSMIYGDCETEDTPGRRNYYHSGPWSWGKIRKEAIYQVTILFAKQWWEAVGGYDHDVEWEDWIFGLKLHFVGIGATYVEAPWGVYRHWTHLKDEGSKSDRDNADFGGEAFKARLGRVYEYIERKEEAMRRCCGKRAKVTTRTIKTPGVPVIKATGHAANRPRKPGTPREDGEQMLIVYDGARQGSFSVNSRVVRGRKYRVTQGQPFEVERGDEWIGTIRDFHEVMESAAPPREVAPPPLGRPLAPSVEMATGAAGPASQPTPMIDWLRPALEVPEVKQAEPEPEEGKEEEFTSLSTIAEAVGENVVELLIEAGLTAVEFLRHDILTNRGRAILDVKGIGQATLTKIKEVVLSA